jgi:ESCRT-II complex subunit VPS36
MNDALKDLDALMVKAREMVRLAGELNDRLTTVTELNASSGGAEPETATFIRSSLAQLGLRMTDVPVTMDMARDEKRWYEQLARELAAVLQGTGGKNGAGMMGDRGIIPLDEVWGGWNRVRGVGEAAYIISRALSVSKKMLNRSSLDSLAIFTGIIPFAGIYGPNNHGTYIPR